MSEEKFQWTREITKLLIELYEQFPCLYQKDDKDYKLKNKRREALNQIKIKLNENVFEGTLTMEEITKKIHGIRTQYYKELNKMRDSRKSGAGSEGIYNSKLWCFKLLHFLRKANPLRTSFSNLTHVNESTDVLSETEDQKYMVFERTFEEFEQLPGSISSDSTPSVSSVRPHISLQSSAVSSIKKDTEQTRSMKQNEPDDNLVLFGKTIVSELKKINNPAVLRHVKKTIYNTVLDAQDDNEYV